MSNTTDNTPVTLVAEENTENTVEKQSFVLKAKTFVKSHKKPAIAVGALVALVGVAAVTGRSTAPSPEYPELSPSNEETEVESEVHDTENDSEN